MKLIVGLGNPGKEYENTRHNCGFKAIDYYTSKNNLKYKNKFDSEYCEKLINSQKIILVKPNTYMNNSGDAVIKFCNYFNIKTSDILIIYDDVDFEIGTFKIKKTGSSGGHNGIKDIINKLKTEDIPRVRIGISKSNYDMINYVLGKFSQEDTKKIDLVVERVANIIDDFANNDIEKLMEKYNKKQ